MRLAILSDLHLEFHRDRGRGLLAGLDATGVDALVVAGDLCTWDMLGPALANLCARFPSVAYVLGNHEFYGCSFAEVRSHMRAIARNHANLHWLDNSTAEVGGRRFVGTTLWHTPSGDDPKYAHHLSDFTAIENFAVEVGSENFRALSFLRKTVAAGDIVVTHHLPAQGSVAPQYTTSILNRFFVCDVERLVAERQPALWIHGHTHEVAGYCIGATRVLCNPLGYPSEYGTGGGSLGVAVDV